MLMNRRKFLLAACAAAVAAALPVVPRPSGLRFAGTETGRFSSSAMNLSNSPKHYGIDYGYADMVAFVETQSKDGHTWITDIQLYDHKTGNSCQNNSPQLQAYLEAHYQSLPK